MFDLASFLVFVTGVVLSVRFFIFNPYSVVGASMEPTFHQGDFIIVDKVSSRFTQYQRGDIIVFVPDTKSVPYIKRVIGLPGETIKLENNAIWICKDTLATDCERLEEPYIPSNFQTKASCGKNIFPLGDDGIFAMGDHRGNSTDSSCCFWSVCGEQSNYQVYPHNIIGKVAMRVLPSFHTYW